MAVHRIGFAGLESSGRAACFLIAARLGIPIHRVTHTPGGLVTVDTGGDISDQDLGTAEGILEACNALCGTPGKVNDFYLKMHEVRE